MEQRKAFSHGLLYSVPPQSLFSLHLKEEKDQGEFEWEERKSNFSGKSIARNILSFLKRVVSAAGRI